MSTQITPLDVVANGAKTLSFVRNAKNWNDKRVYVTLAAPPSTANGDRNLKIYYDGHTKAWVVEPYKGYLSDGMSAALDAFRTHYGIIG